MDRDAHLGAISEETEALVLAARAAGADASVPSCPGWDVGKLVKHLGSVHRWATAIVGSRAREPVVPRSLDLALPEEQDEYPDWLAEGATQLVEVLAAADGDDEVWAWGRDQRVGFWVRRMAHETAVHRWDAQQAAGEPEAIGTAAALDGIDEFLTNLPYVPGIDLLAAGRDGRTVHLHSTDGGGDGEWLVALGPDELSVSAGHAKGDAAVRGPASGLLLFVYGRVAPGALEVHGDAALVERWQRTLRF